MTVPANEVAYAMAFPRAVVAAKARGSERTINEHLAKLLAFDVPEPTREAWRKELLRKHFRYFAGMTIKGGGRVRAADWYRWLYAEPFEGGEVGYTDLLIAQNEDEYRRNVIGAAALAPRFKSFHAALAPELEAGRAGEALLAGM